jgi:hypothetical protein
MQRKALTSLAIALATAFASSAFAQEGLDGVTMRVLDSVEDVDAIVIALDSRAGDEEGERAEEPRREREGAEERDERSRADDDDERRSDLLDDHDEERGEGDLEDRDVEDEPELEPEEPVEGEVPL